MKGEKRIGTCAVFVKNVSFDVILLKNIYINVTIKKMRTYIQIKIVNLKKKEEDFTRTVEF